ncbi:Pentatricopeptide repeat-containing protein [Apostasia shenzhenica]|uniref:Pentatricopeptide repeat-containing protein n=1 Tax=Apostasia shenzhenica TaxID=1088818 RepID=A0A2I0BG54_9ASPA|nr:Pentatricopeptide repeat-containing protein [Apostasia shenzhenica]
MTSTTAETVELYLSQIELSIATKDIKLGRLLHSRLLKTALALYTLLSNRLVDMYAKCGSLPCALSAFDDLPSKNHQSWNTLLAAYSRDFQLLPCALRLFDVMPERNLCSYNTMISCLGHHGQYREALTTFTEMQRNRIGFDKFTIVAIAPACSGLPDLRALRQVHSAIISNGLELSAIMSNVLIDGYGKSGDADSARFVFDQMEERDVVSWTSLIGAYSNANRLDDAYLAFINTPSRNAVTWTALISGLEQHGQEAAAVGLFEQMMADRVNPTPFTLVSILSAFARLGLLDRGKQVHCYMFRRRFNRLDCFNIFTHNALIDMYSKCGDMKSASQLFDEMPERDIVSWNSMITGFAQNGMAKQSINVFERMVEAGISPTHVTFLGVLSACSHGGLVSEGPRFLRLMEEYGVHPRPEHCSALIDVLGRKRKLEEAMEVIESSSFTGGSGSVGMWGALLSACRVHGNVELGRRAAESLFALEPENGARYVTLSNIYAAAGEWEASRRVRTAMKGKGLSKEVGCSWIEVKGGKRVFLAEDKSHFRSHEIYEMLDVLFHQMMEEDGAQNYNN